MPMSYDRHVTTCTTKTLTLKLSELLRDPSFIVPYAVPPSATIEAMIPGGGDWSNCTIPANELDIRIQWKTTEENHNA